jgi:hypothetical protein
MKTNAMTAMLVLALSAPVTAAFAQTDMVTPNDPEMQAFTATKVAAADAVASAETASGGKVVELSLDLEGKTPAYRVTTVSSDGTETNYLVDGLTGTSTLFLEAKSSDQMDGREENDGNSEGNGEQQDNGGDQETAD